MIGCSISAAGAVLTVIALLLALKSRHVSMLSTTLFVMLNLTLAVLLLDVMLLVSQSKTSRTTCKAIAIILHFAVSSCLSWMMNDAVYIYVAIVKVSIL